MRRSWVLAVLFLCLTAAALSAQAAAAAIKTGDAELDATLTAVNAEARSNIGSFYSQISAEFQISAFKIEISTGSGVMEPAEAWLAAALATTTKKNLEEVSALFKKDKKAGWAPVLAALGIKAGSADLAGIKAKATAALAKVKEKNKKS